MQLHLLSPDLIPEATTAENPPPKEEDSATSPSPPTTSSTQPPQNPKALTSLTLPTILLNGSLLSLPSLRNHRAFIPLVLFTRLILLVPHSKRINTRSAEMSRSLILSAGFIVANLAVLKKGYGVTDIVEGFGGGEFGGHAVRALARDAGFGALVSRVLWWGGGV